MDDLRGIPERWPAHTAEGPVLWQSLIAGMTKAEALAACSDLRANAAPAALDSGARSELILPSFILAGDSYAVHAYFFRDRLVQVTLKLDGNAQLAVGLELVTLLRARYGPELSLTLPDPDAFIGTLHADWASPGGANVNLTCMVGLTLNINYQLRVAFEAGKL